MCTCACVCMGVESSDTLILFILTTGRKAFHKNNLHSSTRGSALYMLFSKYKNLPLRTEPGTVFTKLGRRDVVREAQP